MAVADIVLVRKQVLEKLLASPRFARYTDAIGEGSDYTVLTEVTDNILIIDAAICVAIISAPPGHPYASLFMTQSAALATGTKIAEHIGSYGDVSVDLAGVYQPSQPAKSREEILRMNQIELASLYGTGSRFHYIEGNFIFHNGLFAKVYWPIFTKTSVCQSPEAYTDVLVYGSVQLCEKYDMDSQFFLKYNGLYQSGMNMIKNGAEFIPPQQQLQLLTANASR